MTARQGAWMCVAAVVTSLVAGCGDAAKRISVAEYEDKVYASWLGQSVGNMYGLAHEFKYNDEPRTDPIPGWADETLQRIGEANGAFSDDDTDIEYVDLFCMEKYGPEPTYENLAEFWKLCINHHIWVANKAARDLMNRGYLPPLTGRRGVNMHWYQIDPQLVCEIWAVTAPGMLDYAAAKADWAAKVTNDEYGTHPTIWYNTMWSAAFFEKDVEKLCQIGYEHLPADSIFRTAIDDVRKWKAECGDDWVAVRKRIKEKYHDRVGLPEDIATGHVSALLNGTLGVLALLYGEGDFEKTMNYACMAGYDADNQCATLAGLVAIIHGSQSIPRKYLYVQDGWTLPLNDFYKNRTRDHLPDGKITDIAQRTAALGKEIVKRHGGKIEGQGDQAVMIIPAGAVFTPPLEVRLFPVEIDVDEAVTVKPETIGGVAGASSAYTIAGAMPFGMQVARGLNGDELVGTPTRTGRYPLTVVVRQGKASASANVELFVRKKNLARSANRILAAVPSPTGGGARDLEVLRDDRDHPHWDSFRDKPLEEDFYGYRWKQPVKIGRVHVEGGPVFDNGGWFETISVQYMNNKGDWQPVEKLNSTPEFDVIRARKGGFAFDLSFTPVETMGIRIIGKPGGSGTFTSLVELSVHEK